MKQKTVFDSSAKWIGAPAVILEIQPLPSVSEELSVIPSGHDKHITADSRMYYLNGSAWGGTCQELAFDQKYDVSLTSRLKGKIQLQF